MNILITGGAGFLGSHLSERLLKDGHFVLCLDNFSTGFKQNIEPLISRPNFKFLEHDISKPLTIERELHWIFHLASLASPKHYLKNPIKTLKSGLLGTYNCLGIAKAKNAKFFLSSTSEVYGDPQVHPQPEDYWGNVNPIGVRGCYDESKRGAEAITYAYMRQHNVNIRVVRIFNTYGPNMHPDDGRVISNFIVQALRNQDLTVCGDGSQTRSFCYAGDLIEGIIAAMSSDCSLPINLGNPKEVSMNHLAKLILKLTGSKSKIKYIDLPEDDPKKRQPDTNRAKKILNWYPQVSLEQGLIKTITYFKKII
ncbi:MAG: NAD-dependent epimerase/dehydratase family protein [Candidatus Omnitrophica bacterium]|nr:NAD-dependent epimerase/dehydratase family protein [Candidatus Omnitrophota bacterium]